MSRLLTNKEFDERLNSLEYGKEYKRLEDYKGTKISIKFKHKCGEILDIIPHNLLKYKFCPKCYPINKATRINLTTEQFRKKLEKVVGTEYTLISEYKNLKEKILVRHNCSKCNNYEYWVSPQNILYNGKRCPKCAGCIKKTIQDVRDKLNELYPDEYLVLDKKYKNKDSKLNVLHKKCNTISQFTYTNIRNNKFGCKNCKMSSGELKISKILESLNINYIYQYINDNCKDEKVLPFDFKIEIDNEIFIIEFDGRQHFLPIFGNSIEDKNKRLEITKKHDEIKNNFCSKNNYNLLRIKYSDKNIEDKIKKFLNIS